MEYDDVEQSKVGGLDGFSATFFQHKDGSKVLAFRGTEFEFDSTAALEDFYADSIGGRHHRRTDGIGELCQSRWTAWRVRRVRRRGAHGCARRGSSRRVARAPALG